MEITSALSRLTVGKRRALINPRMKNVKYFDLITARRSEYSDEVEKANRKQDLLLTSQMKILERQERVATNILRKTIAEAERLRDAVKDRTNRSLDLSVYDQKRAHARYTGHDVTAGSGKSTAAADVSAHVPLCLPPIHNAHAQNGGSSQSTPRRRKSRDAGLYVRTQPRMLSMRALRDTTAPPPGGSGENDALEVVTTANAGSHPRKHYRNTKENQGEKTRNAKENEGEKTENKENGDIISAENRES